MWTEAENNFDQFLDKFIMHELTKDENDNSNNNVSILFAYLNPFQNLKLKKTSWPEP